MLGAKCCLVDVKGMVDVGVAEDCGVGCWRL